MNDLVDAHQLGRHIFFFCLFVHRATAAKRGEQTTQPVTDLFPFLMWLSIGLLGAPDGHRQQP